jgi:hypothetical protein
MKPMRLSLNWLFLCLLGVGLALAGGCVSTPISDGMDLRLAMTPSGMVMLEDQSYGPGTLPAALKSRRVATDTPIFVAIPAEAPMDMVKDLSRRLASAGYRRVLFTRPKHADAGLAPAR